MYIFEKKRLRQSGFSLYMVLVIMLVIAFLVVATMQSTTMNMRTSANDSDYQLALQNAQTGLQAAQEHISGKLTANEVMNFTCECTNGLCKAEGVTNKDNTPEITSTKDICDEIEVWKRENVFSDNNSDPSIKSTDSKKKYRYVVEYLGQDQNNSDSLIFRVTAKGWGSNERTTRLIEEVVQTIS